MADAFAVTEIKTKAFVALVAQQFESVKGKVLVIADKFDETTYKAGRNVADVQLATAAQVNTEDLLRYSKILITRDALSQVAERTAAPVRKSLTPTTPAL